jgi:fructose-bisphosphate aldolase / 6-deoxy-5-ketofructose 1-phosphate synthase
MFHFYKKEKFMIIPGDIPEALHQKFQENYNAITKNSQKLFLFAGDHKLEKANTLKPEYLFELAAEPGIGAFATHLGLIARYGKSHPTTNYIAKLNGKSNLLKTRKHKSFFLRGDLYSFSLKDPISRQLWSIQDVLTLQKNSGLNIRGVGYTIYLGSSFESEMLREAARIVTEAHQHGLVAILWMYPRGHSVKDELDGEIIAGAAGIGTELGADFVKIKIPSHEPIEWLQKSVESAGNTKVLISGGEKYSDPKNFIKEMEEYLSKTNIAGYAVGRNIFECEPQQAKEMIKKLSLMVYNE